jgi:hypothetical protein
MASAIETLGAQRDALNAHTQAYFKENAEAQAWWNSASDKARAEWSEANLKAATENPKYRGYAALRQSGFAQALDKFDEQFGLSDEETESVLQNFVTGAEKYEEGASAGERFKQNFKDASLGVGDVGSVAGVMLDEFKFDTGRLSEEVKQLAWLVNDVGEKRPWFQSEQGHARTVEKLESELAEKQGQLREKSLEYLKTLATRHGEYAGLPEWEGVFTEGLTALAGQLAGAALSPENLLGGGGAKVAGGVLKRIGVYGARQAGENVAVNMATEPVVQAKRQAEGMQDEFSVKGALVRSGLGALLGWGMGAVSGALPVRGERLEAAEGGQSLNRDSAAPVNVVDELLAIKDEVSGVKPRSEDVPKVDDAAGAPGKAEAAGEPGGEFTNRRVLKTFFERLREANSEAFDELDLRNVDADTWQKSMPAEMQGKAAVYDYANNRIWLNGESGQLSPDSLGDFLVHESGHFAHKFVLGEEFVAKQWGRLDDGQRAAAYRQYAGDEAELPENLLEDVAAQREWVAMQFSRVVRGDTEGMEKGLAEKLQAWLEQVRELVRNLPEFIGRKELSTQELDEAIVKRLALDSPDRFAELKQRAFSQTLQDSPRTKPQLRELSGDFYDPITHPETLAEAQARNDAAGVDRTYQELLSNPNHDTVQTAQGLDLVRRLQNEADYERAADLALILSRQATARGQANSVLAIWNRMTPEGALVAAQRRLKNMADELVPPELRTILEQVDETLKTPLDAAEQVRATNEVLADDPATVWELYKSAAAKELLGQFFPGRVRDKIPLEEMTSRLQKWMSRRLPKPDPKAPDPSRVRKELADVLNNAERIPEIIEEIKRTLPEDLPEDARAAIESDLATGFRGLSEADIDRVVGEQLKALNLKLTDIVNGERSGEAFLARQLPDLITSQLHVSPDRAQGLAKAIQTRLAAKLNEQRTKELNKIQSSMERLQGGIVPKTFLEKFNKLNRLGALDKEQWNQLAADYLKVPRMTPDLQRQIKSLAEAIQNAPGERQRLYHAAQLEMFINALEPKSIWSKVRAARVMAMLLNVKTLVRNIGGNTFMFAGNTAADYVDAAVDPLLSVVSKQRSKTVPSMRARASGLLEPVREFKEGFRIEFPKDTKPQSMRQWMRGVKRGLDYVATLGKLTSQNKMELGQIKGLANYAFDSRVGRGLEKTLAVSLGVPDRGFWWSQFKSSLDNELKLARLNGQALDTPTPDMVARATLDAQKAIYQDENVASKLFGGMRKTLNKLGFKDFGLGDLIIPFTQVPGSLMMRGLEWSPAGFLRTLYEGAKPAFGKGFDQKALVESFSRATLGTTGAVATGYWLHKMGVITAPEESDPDVEAMRRSLGIGGYRINLTALSEKLLSGDWSTPRKVEPGDTVVSYDWAQPVSMGMVMGAEFSQRQQSESLKVKAGQKKAPNTSMALAAILSGAKSMQEQPLLAGLSGFFANAERTSWLEAAYDTVTKDMPASFIPTTLAQVGQYLDNRVYETRGSEEFEEIVGRALARIPGAVEAAGYPPKVDQWGEVAERYPNAGNSWFNVFVNPAFVNQVKADPVGHEMLRLYESTGERGHIPRVSSRKVQVNGIPVELTNEQLASYQQYVGRMTKQVYDRLVLSPFWHNGPKSGRQGQWLDNWRAKQLAGWLSDIHTAAKIDLLGHRPARADLGTLSVQALERIQGPK